MHWTAIVTKLSSSVNCAICELYKLHYPDSKVIHSQHNNNNQIVHQMRG